MPTGALTLRKQLLLNGFLAILGVAIWLYFVVLPHRPKGVPKSATHVDTGFGYDWNYCTFDVKENLDRCTIFNGGGKTIYDEVFLRFDGQSPVPAGELRIKDKQQAGAGIWIELENGVILIPKSRYDRIREIVERRLKHVPNAASPKPPAE